MNARSRAGAEPTPPIRVIAADPQPLFRRAVVQAIIAHPELEIVGDVRNGREALEMIQELQPDVAVLDSALPELDGASVLNAVVRDAPGTKVVLITANPDAQLAYDMVEVGAAGVLSKDVSGKDLCDAIVNVAKEQTVLDRRIQTGLASEIRLRRDRDDKPVLSQREQEVLKLVAKGMSAREIARELYLGTSTVRTHVGHLCEKFGVSRQAALVAEAMRRGFLE